MAGKLGTLDDDYDWRQGLLAMMGSTNKLLTQLRQEIEDYDNIPVGFA